MKVLFCLRPRPFTLEGIASNKWAMSDTDNIYKGRILSEKDISVEIML